MCSVHFSHSVVSDSLRPCGLQHARPPCPSPTPRVYSNSCPSSRWCHPTVLFSFVPLSSCLQSLPATGSFPMSQLFTSGGQSIGVSASTWRPSNEHPGVISFTMKLLDLLAVQGTLKSLLQHHSSKASTLRAPLYNNVLVSAIHHHESAIDIHMSPPSWTSLPLPTPSHPSRLSQSTDLNPFLTFTRVFILIWRRIMCLDNKLSKRSK